MRAIAVIPSQKNSLQLREVPTPVAHGEQVVVETRAIGICGTDLEIVQGEYGTAPPHAHHLIIGHECAGEVASAPSSSVFSAGDWVVPIVRHPDPVPCANCAVGEWDMCSNGQYVEHGIKELHGFAAERFLAASSFLVRGNDSLAELNVLVEPASVVAKAWEHIEHIGRRATWKPGRVLVTGAGPIGLLAAMFAAQRNFDVYVVDRVEAGAKPKLVRELGAHYHSGALEELGESFDIVLECTGAASLFFDVLEVARPNGIVCLTGVSSGGHSVSVDPGSLNRELVLENNVIFGSVNANRRHYIAAVDALARADRAWLTRLINRRVPLDQWEEAYVRRPDDVKTVLTF